MEIKPITYLLIGVILGGLMVGFSNKFLTPTYESLEGCDLCPAGKIEITKIINNSCECPDSIEECKELIIKSKDLEKFIQEVSKNG